MASIGWMSACSGDGVNAVLSGWTFSEVAACQTSNQITGTGLVINNAAAVRFSAPKVALGPGLVVDGATVLRIDTTP